MREAAPCTDPVGAGRSRQRCGWCDPRASMGCMLSSWMKAGRGKRSPGAHAGGSFSLRHGDSEAGHRPRKSVSRREFMTSVSWYSTTLARVSGALREGLRQSDDSAGSGY